MIIQALKDYYDRKAADPESGIAPPGWEVKEIPYLIVLDKMGIPVDVVCTMQGTGKSKTTKKFLVPRGEKITSGIKANLLWGNPEYVVGVTIKKEGEKKHQAFRDRFAELGNLNDPAWKAVQAFLALSLDEKLARLSSFDNWNTLVAHSAVVTFQLAGQTGIVAGTKAIQDAVNHETAQPDGMKGRCLVTNVVEPIEITHAAIKGVWGGKPSGTNIVAFQLRSTQSFGKEQGANAPVGKSAAFAYTTALNTLLDKDSQNRMQVGEASTVFWSEQDKLLEEEFPSFFAEPPKDDPDRGVTAVKALYNSVHNGAYANEQGQKRFFVLGLSPNAARLAIRFWIVSTVQNMAGNILQHFEDTKIVHGPKEKDVLSLFRLLVNTATEGKADNIIPGLEGDLMRAILEKLPYPRSLLDAAVRRTRAERNVTYPRAALIKACLNRHTRFQNKNTQEEFHVSLDLENKNIGYRLGRLFAVLEKIQSEANPGLNATIRDRFYGAASGTPVAVFPNLMRLKNHHLSKLENEGRRIYFEKLLGEIASEIADFPKHLPLDDQGRFAIGYYHQMQFFFTKKDTEQSESDSQSAQ
ncbi:MAG: type I-C CRISPR-associated protein Cas8c/Csd1 [Thermoguttaceae bacterium]|nr:type I-C CRISPR-associated protein Cas8c/Csd1 [Thermoguttaceae bacterium]